MGRRLRETHDSGDSRITARQADEALDRLAAAVKEMSRFSEFRLGSALERVLADLENAADSGSGGIEAVHRLRLWRADYLRLTAELDAATHSLHILERRLGQRVDGALASWQQRFEAENSGAAARPVSALDPRGWLRSRVGWRPPRAQAATAPEDTPEGRLAADPGDPSRELRPSTSQAASAFPAAAPPAGERDTDIEAHVLGPLELRVAGACVRRWSSLKARAVFQYLLMHQGRPIRREALMELEWPEHTHSSARNNLNVTLYGLRNILEPAGKDVRVILHKEGCYLINPALTFWIDRNEFLKMTRDAQRARQIGNVQQAVDAACAAVQLYRGPLFEDDTAGEWYLPERRQLKELYLETLEYLAENYFDCGQLPAAVESARQAISTDSCYEAAHRLLMRCYPRQHQQQLVSHQYRLCAAALHDELDVSPAAETVRLLHTLTSVPSSRATR